jgi:hypothetical protein
VFLVDVTIMIRYHPDRAVTVVGGRALIDQTRTQQGQGSAASTVWVETPP